MLLAVVLIKKKKEKGKKRRVWVQDIYKNRQKIWHTPRSRRNGVDESGRLLQVSMVMFQRIPLDETCAGRKFCGNKLSRMGNFHTSREETFAVGVNFSIFFTLMRFFSKFWKILHFAGINFRGFSKSSHFFVYKN